MEEHYDQIFDTNVKGVLFTVQKALPSVYSVTKAAVRSFGRNWTNDLKDGKIRVNAVSPGPIDTPAFDGLGKTEEERQAVRAQFTSIVRSARMGQSDEIGKVAVFLASDHASFCRRGRVVGGWRGGAGLTSGTDGADSSTGGKT